MSSKTLNLYNGYELHNPAFIVGYYNNDGEAVAAFATLDSQAETNPNILVLNMENVPPSSSLFDAYQVLLSPVTAEFEEACRIICTARNADNPAILEKSGLSITTKDGFDAPIFDEMPMVFGCDVLDYRKELYLAVEIASVFAFPELLNSDNTVDCNKIKFVDQYRILETPKAKKKQPKPKKSSLQRLREKRQKRLDLITELLTDALSKYQEIDCYVTSGLSDYYEQEFSKHYEINREEETILMARDTSFWSDSDQGTVITDKGIYHIADRGKKCDMKFIAWGSILSMKYDSKKKDIRFIDKDNKTLDTINVYSFVKKDAQQHIANELMAVFACINSQFSAKDAEQAVACMKNKLRAQMFYNNFYTPFGNPEGTPFMQFFKIEGGAMIVSRVLSDKINGLWRVMYIEATDNSNCPTIYAKVPNLSMIRYVFKYAKVEDDYFKAWEFPTLKEALSNTFMDNGLRLTKKNVKGREHYMIAMDLLTTYADVCNYGLTPELKQQILQFANECDKLHQEMNRFIMHPRFEFNLKQVKSGRKPYECYVVAGVLAYKIAKLCYSYGSGNDGEDRGVEEALYSMNGVNTDAISNFDPSGLGDLDLGNLDNIDTVAIGNDVDFSGLMSLDYPDLDGNDLLASDVSSGSDNGLTDGLTTGYAADGASGNSASNNYLVDFQSPQPFFETQTDGTVVSTDMFGMPHQWMDMDSALHNTDIMSGLPVESWASNSAASASGSVSFGGSDFTPRETEPDISFYQNQYDDASEKFLEYSEKLKWDEEHGNTDNIDFYRSQMNEAYRSMDYWERTGEMEYHSQKMDCIKTDAILNAADRASADLHATLEAMENRFKH